MRQYSKTISLTKNARGVYSLDPTIGCKSGMENELGGCFGDCYAAKSGKLYGYDFGQTVIRDFSSERHRRQVVKKISAITLPFIRMGTSGDPSENWTHTISIINAIRHCNKEIVIITKHWTNLSNEQLDFLASVNVCINTSVSALDKEHIWKNGIEQYNILKKYCKSVLRIVSADFNLDTSKGRELAFIQGQLFENDNTLDTVLRLNKKNDLIKNGIVNVSKTKFLGKNALVSKLNRNTYFGKCSTCLEMCGVNINVNYELPVKDQIMTQLSLFPKPKAR